MGINMADKENKKINKFYSRRWIITLWCVALITVIVICGYIFKDDSFVSLSMTLSAVPVAFTSLETVKKWKQEKQKDDNND